MGGGAFSASLPSTAFPRLPPAVYEALKARFTSHIQTLYNCVAIPIEAPGKTSHGDVDFVVADPKPQQGQETQADQVNVPHTIIQKVLGAEHTIPMQGNRTSNFAVPIAQGEWTQLGHTKEEDEARRLAEGGEIFYQIDINVCADKNEWDRRVFFHSYGDMGMIMGLITRNIGLVLGEKGLKYPDPPNPPIELSQSFDEIIPFMGMSMDTWHSGFKSTDEVFEWVGTSRFFDPRKFRSKGEGFTKVKQERTMYHNFVQWAVAKVVAANAAGGASAETSGVDYPAEALNYFGKRNLYEALACERKRKADMKELWSGSKVRDWTNLGGYWKGVKLIMDTVRAQHGGDEGVWGIYGREGEEGVKKIVLQVAEDLKDLLTERKRV